MCNFLPYPLSSFSAKNNLFVKQIIRSNFKWNPLLKSNHKTEMNWPTGRTFTFSGDVMASERRRRADFLLCCRQFLLSVRTLASFSASLAVKSILARPFTMLSAPAGSASALPGGRIAARIVLARTNSAAAYAEFSGWTFYVCGIECIKITKMHKICRILYSFGI